MKENNIPFIIISDELNEKTYKENFKQYKKAINFISEGLFDKVKIIHSQTPLSSL